MAYELKEVEVAPNQTIYVQVERELELEEEDLAAGGFFKKPTPEEVVEKFRQLAKYVSDRTDDFVSEYQKKEAIFRPSTVSVSFDIGIEGGAGIPFLAEGKATSNMTLTVEWSP